MASRSLRAEPLYDVSVFINCPFTPDYAPLLQAYVFGAIFCGLKPRTARESSDGGEVRYDKIMRIILGCRWGVHDLSLTEADPANGVARFNMPFELGLFLAAQKLGGRSKACLIFEGRRYENQKSLSDLAGQDPETHGRDPKIALATLRDWIRVATDARGMPGGDHLVERYRQFEIDLPRLCSRMRRAADKLTFPDLCETVELWLAENG